MSKKSISCLNRVVVVEKEPEDEYKSFADFQKEREALKLAPVVQTRAANDGVVDPKWKKMTMVTKDDEVLYAGKVCFPQTSDDTIKFFVISIR